jgi:hypothetical protein
MRAPDRNRYLRAVRHVESAEVPFQEDEIEITVAARILGRPLPMVRPYELPARDFVELNLRAGNDLLHMTCVWELGRKNHFDADGRKHYVDGTIKARADLKRVTFPDVGEVRRRIEGALAAAAGTGLGLKWTPSQTAFIVTTAVGYEDYYTYLATDPAFIHEFQALVHDYCMRELEVALTYPVDVVQVGAVICSRNGPMFSRAMIEEFEYPGLRERVAAVKAKGLPVSIHLDGNASSLFPDLLEMGIDVVNPVEPCEGEQDIYALKRLYGGHLALHGNIDLAGVLARGTPAEVARDVEEHCRRLAGGGGYVCASSHNITEAVPLENFYAMRDAVHAFRFTPGQTRG